jgi:hypothetical protein
MPRPALETVDMTQSDWYVTLNLNFQKLFEAPYPIFQSVGTISADARLFEDCITVLDGTLYISDGTSWNPLPFEVLDFIPALTPGVSTIEDIKTAFNLLLADLQLKKWML